MLDRPSIVERRQDPDWRTVVSQQAQRAEYERPSYVSVRDDWKMWSVLFDRSDRLDYDRVVLGQLRDLGRTQASQLV
jgi:hypothetical protein